ncbi:hypothetical protein KDA_35480 [Dictyobacter alpinus]|uniref:HTH gntR-type domain-containing protein n=1 Tax=Dictyobacter alpinus TaxID=2014873 RepID=A0A402B9L5_9CHLR|nr:substrate-binding domain-containing protein [Dictyobacter alpinus]GCE28064.1 hypothetical protein KDA_35480 [Dictyobacter alpinus]
MTPRQLRADTRVEEVCNSLRKLAFERGPGAQLPTVSALCKELAVSSVTLRDALDHLEMEQIIYRKRSLGIFVSPNIHRKSIHVLFAADKLISELLSPFWALIWLHLEQEAHRREGFKNEKYTFQLVTQIADTKNSLPEEVRHMLQTRRVDGILAVGLHTQGVGKDMDPPLPCITFAGGGDQLVVMDSEEAGRLAAGELIRQGCKRLACWMPNIAYFNVPGWNPREVPHLDMEHISGFTGFRQTLLEQKMTYHPEFMRQPHLPMTMNALSAQEQGYLLAKEVFGEHNNHKPDGLFIGDDLIADGALAALEELEIRVGKELKVVAQRNTGSPILFGHLRKLTALEFNPVDITQAMFSMLDMLMSGQDASGNITWIRPHLR